MKYIYSSSDYRAITNIRCTLVAGGISVAMIIAVNGLGTIFNAAFLVVTPLFESVCARLG
jgi:Flp pilus assembly pilin Flp